MTDPSENPQPNSNSELTGNTPSQIEKQYELVSIHKVFEDPALYEFLKLFGVRPTYSHDVDLMIKEREKYLSVELQQYVEDRAFIGKEVSDDDYLRFCKLWLKRELDFIKEMPEGLPAMQMVEYDKYEDYVHQTIKAVEAAIAEGPAVSNHEESSPSLAAEIAAPNYPAVRVVPEYVTCLFEFLTDFFPEEDHSQLLLLLKGNDIETPIHFLDKGNRLADAFKQLYTCGIVKCSKGKKGLEVWIASNFRYMSQKGTEVFKPRTLEDIISSEKQYCKNPILKIETDRTTGKHKFLKA